MDSIVDFPDREVIEDEAVAWLIRLDGDAPLSVKEERSFEQWLARSPAHRDALKSLNTFWANCNQLAKVVEAPSAVTLRRKHIFAQLLTYLWPDTGFRGSAMASVMMAFALGAVFWLGLPGGITDSNGVYLTAVGQQKTITLSDDSRIQLNTNSQVLVDYSEGFRNIRLLQGEAHFDVAKDPSKPFRVYAGSGRVQAVGTAFNVYLQDDKLDVFVSEGRVALGSFLPRAESSPPAESPPASTPKTQARMAEPAEAAHSHSPNPSPDLYAKSEVNGLGTLAAGQGAVLKKVLSELPGTGGKAPTLSARVELVPTPVDPTQQEHARLAWRRGLLIFSGETLEAAIQEVSRYTSVEIEIVDPALRTLEIGGQIRVTDTESMFKALEANFGLKIKRLSYNRVQVVALAP